MSSMFFQATSFNGDISNWNVGRVTNMDRMFYQARSFNGDISNWNVGRVTNMMCMFYWATSFKRTLCGAAWVNSKAAKDYMFDGSPGSICTTTTTTTATTTATTTTTTTTGINVDTCLLVMCVYVGVGGWTGGPTHASLASHTHTLLPHALRAHAYLPHT